MPRFRASAVALLTAGIAASSSGALAAPRLVRITDVPGVTSITHAGDGSGRLFLTRQAGEVLIHAGGQVLSTPFLDIRPLVSYFGEMGLLSVAFHPRYEVNGFFFVNYTRRPDGATVVARYRVSAADPNRADPASAAVLFVIDQPFSNHNGGQLQFGLNGYLYIGMGDGGSAGDPECRAQRTDTLLGKMLRVDVDGNVSTPPFYSIPLSNPWAGPGDPRPDEVWALGLRNPWRFSFDRLTGDLFIGDVGQDTREEVNFEPHGSPGGHNFGWKVMEGSLAFSTEGCPPGTPPAGNPSLVRPIIEYPHSFAPLRGCSVTGGYRYRGSRLPEVYGAYVYGDLCRGDIWAARPDGPGGAWQTSVMIPASLPSLVTFGEDEAGELYVASWAGIHRLDDFSLSVVDTSVLEPDAGAVPGFVTVTATAPALDPISIDFATAPGSATAGLDYVPAAGTVIMPVGATAVQIAIAVLGDLLDEDDETFSVVIAAPGVPVTETTATVTILDDDPTPSLHSTHDRFMFEGHAGHVSVILPVTLSAPSGRLVSAAWATADGSATGPDDYVPGSGVVTFPPGATTAAVIVSVLGDTRIELDEAFSVVLSFPVNATLADPEVVLTILDDDAPPIPGPEVSHGYDARHTWRGARRGVRTFRMAQAPRASYEVLVEAVAGANVPVTVERLGADNRTVLQSAVPAPGFSAASMAWENRIGATITSQHVRVIGGECDGVCAGQDGFRIRVYETTAAAPRFNNTGSQVTILVVQNTHHEPVSGHADFWSPLGDRITTVGWTAAAQGSFVLNTSAVPGLAGASGSLSVTSDAPHGTLAGKAVVVEPATGLSFDTPVIQRTR